MVDELGSPKKDIRIPSCLDKRLKRKLLPSILDKNQSLSTTDAVSRIYSISKILISRETIRDSNSICLGKVIFDLFSSYNWNVIENVQEFDKT